MTQRNKLRSFLRLLFLGLLIAVFAAPLAAQINPAEIREPHLRTIEKAYFPQLVALNRAILAVKYPFPFVPSPYVGLDPGQQVGADTRGLEFVRFHGRVVLKISGNYNAAYNSTLMTRNERASRTFQDVVAPIFQRGWSATPSASRLPITSAFAPRIPISRARRFWWPYSTGMTPSLSHM